MREIHPFDTDSELIEWTAHVEPALARYVHGNMIALLDHVGNAYRVQCNPITWHPTGEPRLVHFITKRPTTRARDTFQWGPADSERSFRVGFPTRRAPRRFRPPSFTLHPNGTDPMYSGILQSEIRKAGPYLVNEWYWLRFPAIDGSSHFGVIVEVESRSNGTATCELIVTNGVRDPRDKDGADTDGELFYHWLSMEVEEHVDVNWPILPPNVVPRDRSSWYLSAPRSQRGQMHYLREGARATFRCVLSGSRVDPTEIQAVGNGRTFARPDTAYYGPQVFPLPNFTAAFVGRGKRGWSGAEEISAREANQVVGDIERGVGGSGLLYGAEWHSPNPGGMQHMTLCSAYPYVPDWTFTASFGHSMYRRGRNPDGMYHPDSGAPITTDEMAAANGGKMPWNVHNTPGAFEQPNKSLPLPRNTGRPWNEGECDYLDAQRAWKREDAAHTSRRLWHEITRHEVHGSLLARDEVAHIAEVMRMTWTPYEVENDRGQGPWMNNLARLRAAPSDWGDGSLGRQIAWPLIALAHTYQSQPAAREPDGSDPARGSLLRYIEELWSEIYRVASPTACTRKRTAPNWSHANPPPDLPSDSTEVVDQSFEVYFVVGAAFALYRACGIESGLDFVVAHAKALHHEGRPAHIEKWMGYANTETGIRDVLNVTGGGSGFSQILNPIAFALAYPGRFEPHEYEAVEASARALLGIGDEASISDAIFAQSSGWTGWFGHETTRLQYGAHLAAWDQYKAAFTEARDAEAAPAS